MEKKYTYKCLDCARVWKDEDINPEELKREDHVPGYFCPECDGTNTKICGVNTIFKFNN